MNVRYLIDGIFHACVYSHIPLLILQQNQRFFFVKFIDSPERASMRWFVNDSLAFLYFWAFQLSGIRNRYVLWHMERNNILSGFHPYELLAVCFYFSVLLCLPTEITLLWWPNENPFLTNQIWMQQLSSRMILTFLISTIYHISLEKTGMWAFLRARYFGLEFLQ